MPTSGTSSQPVTVAGDASNNIFATRSDRHFAKDPERSCRRKDHANGKRRLRLRTLAMRVRLPMIASKSRRVRPCCAMRNLWLRPDRAVHSVVLRARRAGHLARAGLGTPQPFGLGQRRLMVGRRADRLHLTVMFHRHHVDPGWPRVQIRPAHHICGLVTFRHTRRKVKSRVQETHREISCSPPRRTAAAGVGLLHRGREFEPSRGRPAGPPRDQFSRQRVPDQRAFALKLRFRSRLRAGRCRPSGGRKRGRRRAG